jgi:PBP superfamily domain
MRKPFLLLTFPFLLILAACTSSAPTAQAPVLRVQYTFAAQPWLADLSNCAGEIVVNTELRAADYIDLSSADLALRLGDTGVTTPAYQIGADDILVVVNRQNPINRLTAEEVLGLFTGSIQTWKSINGSDSPVQVWVFAAGEDVQQIFEQAALGGAPVASTARLATDPDEMAQAVTEDVNAVGILTRHWKAGNVSDVYTVATVPVLAIFPAEPQGAMADLAACLQK